MDCSVSTASSQAHAYCPSFLASLSETLETPLDSLSLEHQRDVRIDFFRGAALLIILVDHLEAQTHFRVVRSWTPVSLGFSDGAEAFVFLSGLTCGIVYQRRLRLQGVLFCETAALKRALQIYLAYLVTVWICLIIGVIFQHSTPLLNKRLGLEHGSVTCAAFALTMCYHPFALPILPFYAIVLPWMPLMVVLFRRCGAIAWLISFSLYVAAQLLPSFHLSDVVRGGEWFFNPFAWQFLFVIGLACGVDSNHVQYSQLVRYILLCGATVVVVLSLLIRKECFSEVPFLNSISDAVISIADNPSSKTRLHPIRVFHFICVAYCIAQLLPDASSPLSCYSHGL